MPCLWSPFLPFQPLAANQGPTLTWGNLAPGPSFGAGDKRWAKKNLDQASRTKSFPKKTTKPRWNHPDKETRSFHELGLSEGILPIEFLALDQIRWRFTQVTLFSLAQPGHPSSPGYSPSATLCLGTMLTSGPQDSTAMASPWERFPPPAVWEARVQCSGLPGVSRPRGYQRLTWDICKHVFGSLDKRKKE